MIGKQSLGNLINHNVGKRKYIKVQKVKKLFFNLTKTNLNNTNISLWIMRWGSSQYSTVYRNEDCNSIHRRLLILTVNSIGFCA